MKIKLFIALTIFSIAVFLLSRASTPSSIENITNSSQSIVTPSPTPSTVLFEDSIQARGKTKTLHITDNSTAKPTFFNLTFPESMKVSDGDIGTYLHLDDDSEAYFNFWSDIKEFEGRRDGSINLPQTKQYTLNTKTDMNDYEHSYYSESYLYNGNYYYKHTIIYNDVPYYFSVKIREDKLEETEAIMNSLLANMTPSTVTKEGYDKLMDKIQN